MKPALTLTQALTFTKVTLKWFTINRLYSMSYLLATTSARSGSLCTVRLYQRKCVWFLVFQWDEDGGDCLQRHDTLYSGINLLAFRRQFSHQGKNRV